MQFTIIEILMKKLKKAAIETGINQIAVAGGVSANSGLRDAIRSGEALYGWQTYVPEFQFTTDNAAMIAIAGYFKYLQKEFLPIDFVPYAKALHKR
jgi:N6-L-threonylcarbamoyladenine synthase